MLFTEAVRHLRRLHVFRNCEDFCLSGAVFAGTFIAFTLPILLFHFFFLLEKRQTFG